MYSAIKNVEPIDDYKLILTFEGNIRKQVDMRPYLDKGVFKELQDKKIFNSVKVAFDTIEWSNGADIDPESLFNLGKLI